MYCPDSRVPKSCANLGGNLAEFIANEHEHFRADQVLATQQHPHLQEGWATPAPPLLSPPCPLRAMGSLKSLFKEILIFSSGEE